MEENMQETVVQEENGEAKETRAPKEREARPAKKNYKRQAYKKV